MRPLIPTLLILLISVHAGPLERTNAEVTVGGRPEYEDLRQDEDYSFLARSDPDRQPDFFDPIKYIPLNESATIWSSFGGQYRTRVEVWNHFNFGDPETITDHDVFLLNRLLFHFDLHLGNFRIFLQGKSALINDRDLLGGQRSIDVDQLDLQNGFADLTLPLSSSAQLTLRGGRQEMLFGKQRLVGPLDWVNTRRTFDGGSATLQRGHVSATGFWTRPVLVDKYRFNEADDQIDFYGIYSTAQPFSQLHGLDLYWLGLHNGANTLTGTSGTEDRHTIGGRIWGAVPHSIFEYELEGAYQLGELGGADISAFMVVARLVYTLAEVTGHPQFHVEFDYASGDDKAGDDKVETFNQLFPTGHAFLGYIDTVGRQNIIDFTGGIAFDPWKSVRVSLDSHHFMRASEDDALYNASGAVVRAGEAGSSKEVGTEIDLTLRCRFNRHAMVLLGHSHFFAGEFIRESGPSEDIDFSYLAFQYTF